MVAKTRNVNTQEPPDWVTSPQGYGDGAPRKRTVRERYPELFRPLGELMTRLGGVK